MPRAVETQHPARTTYSAPALEKGLEIIELLAAERRPMSTRAIAERLGRSEGEIFRVVFVLVERGYLRRDSVSDELTLRNRLFAPGVRTPRAREPVQGAVPATGALSGACAPSPNSVVVSNCATGAVAPTAGPSAVSLHPQLG